MVDSKRLKDAVLVVTCCISFVAAFAVAMTTIARSGAKHLVAALAILVPIVLLPPVLVSLCLSRLKPEASSPFLDEENSSAQQHQQQQPSWWHQFVEPEPEDAFLDLDDEDGQQRFGQQVVNTRIRDEVSVTRFHLVIGLEQAAAQQQVQQLKEAVLAMSLPRRMCPNVLPLLGFSVHSNTLLLASPRLPTLATILASMTWPSRVRVAALVARGLSHLHHAAQQPVLHGDLTPHRIRMHQQQEEWIPYIADAGILKLTSMPLFPASNSNWCTPGFAAPECTSQQQSTKSDVYSFGVLLLVLLTGRTGDLSVASQLRRNISRLVDDKLGGHYVKEQAQAIQRTACCCTRKKPGQRPDMIRVEAMLRPLLNTV